MSIYLVDVRFFSSIIVVVMMFWFIIIAKLMIVGAVINECPVLKIQIKVNQ